MHPGELSVLCTAREQTHTHTHAHDCATLKNHTGDMGVCVSEGAFIPTSLSLSNTHPYPPTPPFFFVFGALPHCLFHTITSCSHPHTPFFSVKILPPALTQAYCLPLSHVVSHEFLYHRHIPEHRGHPAAHTLHCSAVCNDSLSSNCGLSSKSLLAYCM